MPIVRTEITGNVWQVRVAVGDQVVEGHELVILESMKMEIPVVAPSAGVVVAIVVSEGQSIQEGDVVAELG
jgi:acetyl-CoA carboxylase biotin carboxyl carrier protein